MSDSDSEAEEIQLEELETMLKEHDPDFQKCVTICWVKKKQYFSEIMASQSIDPLFLNES